MLSLLGLIWDGDLTQQNGAQRIDLNSTKIKIHCPPTPERGLSRDLGCSSMDSKLTGFEGPTENSREASKPKRAFCVCFPMSFVPYPASPTSKQGHRQQGSFYIQLLPMNKKLGGKGTKGSRPRNSLI